MLNVVMAVLLASAAGAATAGPTETVRAAVQQVFVGQDGGPVKTAAGPARRAEIRKVAESLFDFHEMSRRSLGPSWDQVSAADREEFVRLFTNLVSNAYMGKIEQYTGEPITYVGERVDGDEAAVRSRVVTPKGSEIGIEYRLYRQDGRWAVYDVYVDGISLVGSYRAQFKTVLQRSSFPELLKQLRLKAGS